jgi:hypothetical protein
VRSATWVWYLTVCSCLWLISRVWPKSNFSIYGTLPGYDLWDYILHLSDSSMPLFNPFWTIVTPCLLAHLPSSETGHNISRTVVHVSSPTPPPTSTSLQCYPNSTGSPYAHAQTTLLPRYPQLWNQVPVWPHSTLFPHTHPLLLHLTSPAS